MKKLYSIGEVAAETGLSVDTIRVWERRYGLPEPVRLPSGHRRYTAEQINWLRRVAEALALGYRPGHIVRAGEEELSEILARETRGATSDAPIEPLIEHVRGLRGPELKGDLERAWAELDPREFLGELLAPFLVRVGRKWADGELEVRHEHFVSELVHDLLRDLCTSLPQPAGGPLVVLTTLSGEQHSLGLRMVALACAVRGVAFTVLGTDLPTEQISRAAEQLDARWVLVSVSLATAGPDTDRALTALRRALPPGTGLVVGGRGIRGARRGPRGVRYIAGFEDLDELLLELGDTGRVGAC